MSGVKNDLDTIRQLGLPLLKTEHPETKLKEMCRKDLEYVKQERNLLSGAISGISLSVNCSNLTDRDMVIEVRDTLKEVMK